MITQGGNKYLPRGAGSKVERVNESLWKSTLLVLLIVNQCNSLDSKSQFRLECQPGEQRYFNYESSTSIWGSTNQQVRMQASLRIRCLESPTNTTLKYLVDVLSVEPDFRNSADGVSKESSRPLQGRRSLTPQDDLSSVVLSSKLQHSVRTNRRSNEEETIRAEPVLEEVGEAINEVANRVKRSVSGWFSKTWTSVKDFFVNVFNSSEKSVISREQANKESGLDIAAQCKAGKNKPAALPIDDSVFDDLEPKYYIGASSVETLSANAYDLEEEDVSDPDEDLSFFDDPKPKNLRRNKRAASGKSTGIKVNFDKDNYDRLLQLPFIFIQSKSGKIVEIRFSSDEIDLSVKNFKRHLCDLFATNLDKSKTQMDELSPIGQHTTKYLVDSSTNSSIIKQSLMKASGGNSPDKQPDDQSKQLVKVLALMASTTDTSDSPNLDGRDPAGQQVNNGDSLSILRTINSTSNIQLASRTVTPDIEKIEVRVKQVQQISDGRLTGTAGQMGMSLIPSSLSSRSRATTRFRRSINNLKPVEGNQEQLEDIADLLQVSTSFSVHLVPKSKLGNFGNSDKSTREKREVLPPADKDDVEISKNSSKILKSYKNSTEKISSTKTSNSTATATTTTRISREPLVSRRPSDPLELQKTLKAWQQLESRLEFTTESLIAESGNMEGQKQRLDILRNQVQMRLNEEYMRNKFRRKDPPVSASLAKSSSPSRSSSNHTGNDIGLSLSQLILDSGFTSKKKGSMYATLEEIVELELSLGEESEEDSMSKLLRDTARVDKLKKHCRSAIATIDEIRAQSNRLELKAPFNIDATGSVCDRNGKMSRIVSNLLSSNRKRLEQCKQVSQLLLKVGDRQVADLVISLMDECNNRMLAAVKNEELGYGPTSKYYRNLRQQFAELMMQMNRPTEALVDKLVQRLHYTNGESIIRRPANRNSLNVEQPEFTYISPKQNSDFASSAASNTFKYNKSLLREEDDYNNSEGAGSLAMSITYLAAQATISRRKRVEIAEELLKTLKRSSCSLFEGPDLDILESMGNFHEPMDEIVGKIVHLARRCRHQDQYVIACIHGLQGQLQHATTQRFLVDQLRSLNASCTLKSEIVLVLTEAILLEELKRIPPITNDLPKDSAEKWPIVGTNSVDDTLLELVEEKNKKYPQDRRCLKTLVAHYFSRKLPISNDIVNQLLHTTSSRRRSRRSVKNDDKFWDEANCKRWILPDSGGSSASNSTDSVLSMAFPNEDSSNGDIDDNSLLISINQSNKARNKNQKLVERESDASGSNATSSHGSQFIRRRHKCSASKSYGPKNAEAMLKAEIVNDLVGSKDENKFLARFRLATNFLGNKIDVGRMYLWHQKRMTRAHVNILGKSLWDTSHSCHDKTPKHLLYMPLFDFNLWLVKVSVGLRLQGEMGFFSSCTGQEQASDSGSGRSRESRQAATSDDLEIYPTISLRASGEASAKFVVARAGISLGSQYGYQGNIKVSRQPASCMSIYSAHQPMNVTLSSWFQLWDNDCHFWGSRNRAEPQAIRWRLAARPSTAWIEDECLIEGLNATTNNESSLANSSARTLQSINP